jgi:hypothetical protein
VWEDLSLRCSLSYGEPELVLIMMKVDRMHTAVCTVSSMVDGAKHLWMIFLRLVIIHCIVCRLTTS